jgi:hypothetical protein
LRFGAVVSGAKLVRCETFAARMYVADKPHYWNGRAAPYAKTPVNQVLQLINSKTYKYIQI